MKPILTFTRRPVTALAMMALMVTSLCGCVNLSGLSGETQYACAAPEGVACQSVSGTYANAVHQNLPSQRTAAARKAQARGQSSGQSGRTPDQPPSDVSASSPARQPIRPGIAPTVQLDEAQANADGLTLGSLRSLDRVLRLWTKAWEDADGDLWDQGYVYVQVDDGHWQIDHVQRQIRDRYAPLHPPLSPPLHPPPTAPSLPPGTAPAPADEGAPTTDAPTLQRPASTSPYAGQRQPSPFPSLTLPSGRPGPGPQGATGAQ